VRILGLGDNTVDTYVDRGQQYPGGNAVNVAVMTGRLGADSHYLGCVGHDPGGDLILAALAAEGVSTVRCRQRAGENARAYIGHRNGDRYSNWSRPGVRAQYDFGPDDFAYMAEFDAIHAGVHGELDAILPQIRARQILSFDFSNRWTTEFLERTLPHCQAAFLSDPDLSDEEASALLLRCVAAGPDAVVILRGDRSTIAHLHGKMALQPPIPTQAVDTLGVRDAFISAFLVAVLQNKPLEIALLDGASHSALASKASGAFGHMAPWAPPEHW
jgi:fructoselysine 6-kinase